MYKIPHWNWNIDPIHKFAGENLRIKAGEKDMVFTVDKDPK